MDTSRRYGRWLSMMCALLYVYVGVSLVQAGYYLGAISYGLLMLWMLWMLYKRGLGAKSLRQIAVDLGGAILTLSILWLMLWGYLLMM